MVKMVKMFNVPPGKIAFRARAVHRLARQKRWPAYVFASVAQEFPHEFSHEGHESHPELSIAIRAIHIALLYISFTLID